MPQSLEVEPRISLWPVLRVLAPLWLTLAIVGSCFTYAIHSADPIPFSWQHSVRINFVAYGIWATILTPIVIWLCTRYPLKKGKLPQVIAIHLIGMFGIALFSASLRTATHPLTYPGETARPALQLFRWYFVRLAEGDLLLYWATALTAYALSYRSTLHEQEIRAARLETQLATGRLQMLTMQLQPHFLFNTLHSIAGLIHVDGKRAEQMITSLGDFLRLSLETTWVQEVTLQRELELLQHYLDIQMIRYHDRLQLEMKIAPETLDALVPYMLFQPLLENAVQYGIEWQSAGGAIEVQSWRAGDCLNLSVINGIETPISAHVREGVGLGNIKKRLQVLYGTAQSFRFGALQENKFHVEIRIPLRIQARSSK